MSNKNVSKKIYKNHLSLVRELNDTFIFVNSTYQVLETYWLDSNGSKDKVDYEYLVPTKKNKKGSAYRTEQELADIYGAFLNQGMYESYLSTLVSKYESFLYECLKIVLLEYPQKRTINTSGIKIKTDINIEVIFENSSIEKVQEHAIDNILIQVFYADPKNYSEYFKKITGIEIDNDLLDDFYELKGTRDLIIHNNSIVNDVYLKKVGRKARATQGLIVVNKDYFEHSIALLKRLSGIISRETLRIYGNIK